MAKQDNTDKWKKEVEMLRFKLNEYEETITKLKSDDSTQDAKIENLNKLHSQKIRALMQSIQELKKQNASIRALNKENNRSKLIEKLKTELLQQEIAIQALRDLISDNDRSDEQIIKYLNKGPPRIRPLSREEMKIKIRKLESRLGISKKTPGDQAVDDLESMLNPSKSQASEEFGLVDPLQNEKIIEIMEQVQNLQLEIRSKDSIIEHLRSQIHKLQDELQLYKNKETEDRILGIKSEGIKSENQSIKDKLAQHSGSVQELQLQLENALIELRSKNDLISSLKKTIDSLSNSRGGKDKEVERLRKELNQSMNSVHQLEKENGVIKAKYDQLLEELKNKDIELEEHKILASSSVKVTKHSVEERVDDYKDLEIAALQEKIQEIQKQSNLPETFMAAERAETEKYKDKVRELFMQVGDLQEEVEFYQTEIVDLKRQGAAKALASRVPEERPDLNEKINYKEQFEKLAKELATLKVENSRLQKELKISENELNELRELQMNMEIEKNKHIENLEGLKSKYKEQEMKKVDILKKNSEIVSEIITNYNNTLPKLQIVVSQNFQNSELMRISDNLAIRLIKKK
jgi:chromosome segregation ATPase